MYTVLPASTNCIFRHYLRDLVLKMQDLWLMIRFPLLCLRLYVQCLSMYVSEQRVGSEV